MSNRIEPNPRNPFCFWIGLFMLTQTPGNHVRRRFQVMWICSKYYQCRKQRNTCPYGGPRAISRNATHVQYCTDERVLPDLTPSLWARGTGPSISRLRL